MDMSYLKKSSVSVTRRVAIQFAALLVAMISLSLTGCDFGEPPSPKALSRAAVIDVMQRVADWQIEHPKHDPWDWTNGTFYAGVLALYQTTGDQRYLDELLEVGAKTGWRSGPRVHEPDDHAIAHTYLDLARMANDESMAAPFRQVADLAISTSPAWTARHQVIEYWWCDLLFMSPPAFVKLSSITGDPGYADFAHGKWLETYALLYDAEEHLFYRDARYLLGADGSGAREPNGAKVFWSRGNGWVLAGTARVLDELAPDDPRRAFYLNVFREMAAKVASLQPTDGLWRSSLLDPGSFDHGESSGTAFFTYALAWGVNAGILDKAEYLPIIEKAWTALTGNVDQAGKLGWVQAIGGEPAPALEEDWETYASGAFLLAGREVFRLLGGEPAASTADWSWQAEDPDQTILETLISRAELGDPFAQTELGFFHGLGEGVAQDAEESVKWYTIAAERGFPLAPVALGQMYAEGKLVGQDDLKAHMYFNLAGAWVGSTVESMKDLEERMSPEDIARARAMARQWVEETAEKKLKWPPSRYEYLREQASNL